ncbi:transporter substrate-binding domain-containing protein [Sulfurimonas sp.]|nr:transporter substrate-binding domain-containing protein [Sulfurimonas sp.]
MNFLLATTVELTEKEHLFIKKHPIITIASTTDSAPLLIKKHDGTFAGIDFEIAELIYKHTGLKIVFQDNTWADSIQKAKDRKVDGVSASVYNREREEFFNVSNGYMKSTPKVYVRKGNPKNIKTIKDLENKTIVIRKGTLAIEKVAKNLKNNIIYKDTSIEMIKTLINEEADYVFFFDNVEYILEKEGLDYIDVAFTFGKPRDIVFSVRNDWPELVSIINKGLDSIPDYQKVNIRKKWFGIASERSIILTDAEKAYLKDKGPIKMCIDPNWMPFEKVDKNAKHIGIAADILKIIQRESTIEFSLVPTDTWLESMELAKQRKCDIFSLAMETPSRKLYMDFTKPYVSFPFVIATKNSEMFIENINALYGKKVSLVKGYAFIELMKVKYPLIEVVEVDSLVEGLDYVRESKVYGHIDPLASLAYTLREEGMTDLKIAGKFDDLWSLSIATRNDEPILQSIMQKALDSVEEEDIQSIYNKWLSIKFEDRIDYTLVYEMLVLLVLITSLSVWRYRVMQKTNNIIQSKNEELEKAYKQYSWLAENMDDVVWVMDISGKVVYISPSVEKLRGFTVKEVKNQTFEEVISKGSREIVIKEMFVGTDAVNNGETPPVRNMRVEQPCKDGSTIWTEVNARLVVDAKTGGMRFIGVSRDISKTLKYEQELERVAVTDRLTNLYNRHKIDEMLQVNKELADRYDTPFGIIMLDIDHFKNINDVYGHNIGDVTLQAFSNIIIEHSRESDIVGRWGGEEFLIIVPYATQESIMLFAENVREKIQKYNFESIKHITASFGLSIYNKSESCEEIVARADRALYDSKENGRNKVSFAGL